MNKGQALEQGSRYTFSFLLHGQAIFYVAVFVGFYLLDPFALRSAAEKHYNHLVTAILSPFYSSDTSKQITIVLFDDSYFRTYQETLANYSNLSMVLRRINRHQPATVYVNLLQHFEHSPRIEKWLRRLKKSPTAVNIASLPLRDSALLLANSEGLRSRLSEVAHFAAVRWQGASHHYPMHVNWHKDATQEEFHAFPQQKMPTPALAMYAQWCKAHPSRCESWNGQALDASHFTHPMYVQWFEYTSPHQAAFMSQHTHCASTEATSIERAWARFTFYIHYGFGQKTQAFQQPCPPYLTVSATRLLDGSLSDEQQASIFNQRAVLIGNHRQIGNVDSPIHGSVASVYLHATAVDNLMRRGADYWRMPEPSQWWRLSLFDVIQLIFQSMLIYIYFLIHQRIHQGHALRQIISVIAFGGLLFALLLASAVLFANYFQYGIATWFVLPILMISALFQLAKQLFLITFERLASKVSAWFYALKRLRH